MGVISVDTKILISRTRVFGALTMYTGPNTAVKGGTVALRVASRVHLAAARRVLRFVTEDTAWVHFNRENSSVSVVQVRADCANVNSVQSTHSVHSNFVDANTSGNRYSTVGRAVWRATTVAAARHAGNFAIVVMILIFLRLLGKVSVTAVRVAARGGVT
jgi:hypothetical protein